MSNDNIARSIESTRFVLRPVNDHLCLCDSSAVSLYYVHRNGKIDRQTYGKARIIVIAKQI